MRHEAVAGRKEGVAGLNKEATAFYEYVVQLTYGDHGIPDADQTQVAKLIQSIVTLIQQTIGVLDFWDKAIEVKKLRGDIDTEIVLADIPALNPHHERLAVEIMKLAEKRQRDLLA